MFFTLLTSIAFVSADFAGDAHVVIASASNLNSAVQVWGRDHGLVGAIAIQRNFYPFSSAIKQLESSSGEFEINQGNAEAVGQLLGTITSLLNDLSAKAADLNAIGAGQIVQSDVNALIPAANNIVSSVYTKGKHDCDFVKGLASPVSELNKGFANCASGFKADNPSFPALKC